MSDVSLGPGGEQLTCSEGVTGDFERTFTKLWAELNETNKGW